MITHFVCLTIYFITRMHPCQSKCHTFCLAAVYVSYSVTSPMFFPLGNHDTKLAILCVFTCVKYTHPMLICGGTGARTDGRTENIYSIFRDKLLLLGEHVYHTFVLAMYNIHLLYFGQL